MRKTQILFSQHIGRMIKFHWYLKGKVKVIPTTTEEILKSRGHEVVDVKEFLYPQKKKAERGIGCFDELTKEKDHANYNCEPCYKYTNDNVPIEGLEQAKVLTNTVEICQGLPEALIESEKKLSLPDEIHLETEKKIKLSCMFDAKQELLPKRKDPLRPAWIFPREYGITESRKIDLLCKNLLTVCEQFADNVRNKAVILDAFFSVPLEAYNKKIQFEITSELLVTTGKKLKFMADPSSTHGLDLPDMGPVDCTIGLNPHSLYVMQDNYPVGMYSKWPYVQTALVHYNHTVVKNNIEEKVTESQIQGRSLLIGYTIAEAEARAAFGCDVKKLPEPVLVPVVQIDGKMFHFTIFQLNTLDLNKDSEVRNIFWNSEMTPLYSACEYKAGRPILEGYNPDIIRRLINFYNIQ